jgi:signal transduction histidine kinase
MKISQRLYLTVAPALLGVVLMAGLLYWGRYAFVAPTIVLVIGGLAVLASGILAWSNARFVAQRIEHLASTVASDEDASAPDELERIAQGMTRLGSDVRTAERNRVEGQREFEGRIHDYATLLAVIADDAAKHLEEVRLPLHILLENRFGDLNENQEEMLGAARAAAENADADLVSLRQIAGIDLGEIVLRRDRLRPSEIVESLRPMLVAAAESVGATIEIDVAPLLPAILGDRVRLQDALSTLLADAVRSSASGGRVRLHVDQVDARLEMELTGIGDVPSSVRATAATRVIHAHGGSVTLAESELTIALPIG